MRHVYLISYSYNGGAGHQDFSQAVPLQPEHLPPLVGKLQRLTGGTDIIITNIYKFEQPAPRQL